MLPWDLFRVLYGFTSKLVLSDSMRILPIQIRHVNVSDETLLLGEQVPEELANASMGPFGFYTVSRINSFYRFLFEFYITLEDFKYSNKAF